MAGCYSGAMCSEVILESFGNLVSMRILSSKPKVIAQLEQRAQPWVNVQEVLPGIYAVQEYCFETKTSAPKQNTSEGSALEEHTKPVMCDIGLDWED